jgi:hypothetical protein
MHLFHFTKRRFQCIYFSFVENEAVVAELLRSHRGEMELVDARQFLPLMRCRAGMISWFVLDDSKVGTPAGAAAGSSSASGAKDVSAGANDASTNNAGADAGSSSTSNQTAISVPLDTEFLPAAVRECIAKGFRLFRSVADVPDSHNMRKRFRQSLFPPTAEEAEWMHLGERAR